MFIKLDKSISFRLVKIVLRRSSSFKVLTLTNTNAYFSDLPSLRRLKSETARWFHKQFYNHRAL